MKDHVGVSQATWYRYISQGRAPRPFVKGVLGHGSIAAWRGQDILNWLKNPITYAENFLEKITIQKN